MHPEDTDWTDVADLNYNNQEMRKEMIANMSYWLTKEGIDGLRCDVAGSVPANFWEQAIPELRAKKDIFMLAKAWEPALLKEGLFDMTYAWDGHHAMNKIAKGEEKATAFMAYMEERVNTYEANDILMNFVTNHDENSWNGTIKERMGNASETMTVLSYLTPGMPLIYSGQEYDLDHKLLFFEKDSFPHTKSNTWKMLEKLGRLKNTSSALNGGKDAASFEKIETSNENILAFKRSKNGSVVIYLANMSNEEQSFKNVINGEYLNYMNNIKENFQDKTLLLQPWEYKVLIK